MSEKHRRMLMRLLAKPNDKKGVESHKLYNLRATTTTGHKYWRPRPVLYANAMRRIRTNGQ